MRVANFGNRRMCPIDAVARQRVSLRALFEHWSLLGRDVELRRLGLTVRDRQRPR